MFIDVEGDVIGFNSCADEERLRDDKQIQTNALEVAMDGTGTCDQKSAEIQTATDHISKQVSDSVSYDADKLAIFLKRILPKLEEELNDSAYSEGSSNAQEGHQSIWHADNELSNDKSFEFSIEQFPFKQDCSENMSISDLTWNSTGGILAIAFSLSVHEGWCNHETSIFIYSTNKTISDKPQTCRSIKISSCVRCIKFHPFVPTLLAGGFYNGEVAIWDLTNDDETMLTKEANDFGEIHCDGIKNLVWKNDRNGVKLVTGDKDGNIIFWKVTVSNLTFKGEDRFCIFSRRSARQSVSFDERLEINAIGFWTDNECDFVVAACDKVFHCSCKPTKMVNSMPQYKDPITMMYKSHEGLATCVSCLCNTDIFASCGIDGKIHINKSQMDTPIYIINSNDPVLGIAWTNSRSLASWGTFPHIKSYNLNTKPISVASIREQEVGDNVSAVTFDMRRPMKMAIARDEKIIVLKESYG